ncbi:hypothetical protein XA68_14338 [Ophiocordyceps unilateralis]|uniref:Aminoglycoside phosphotransferase domain-containing protein n=1 Tax=Ophiocordyceps unilateralis TaxID=268505 RepID=A0A2A9P965_OPHUN|nr:hypothetical protein XA68_14338 [Ophiocordyceps unilateralis]
MPQRRAKRRLLDAAATDPNRLSPQPVEEVSESDSVTILDEAPAEKAGEGTSSKRSRHQFEASPVVAVNGNNGESPGLRKPPVFPGVTAKNKHTAYLETFLQYRQLELTTEPPPSLNNVTVEKKHCRFTTDAGLIMNELVRIRSNVPIVRLPKPEELGEFAAAAAADIWIERTSRGVILEDLWPELSSEAKHDLAHDLSKIITDMRKTSQPALACDRRIPGSVFSGLYSLLMDKREAVTYWAVRKKPTFADFIAFLFHHFRPGVPSIVSASLASKFSLTGRLVLSHGELSPRNIIVLKDKIVGIIGWECSGWYPEWWDYVKFFEARVGPANQDWFDYAPKIFKTQFQEELVAYQGLRRYQSD